MPTSFGLSNVWTQGDTVTRLILMALLTMSVISWVVISLKTLAVWRHRQNALGSEQFWRSTSLAEGMNALGQRPGNLFHALAQAANNAAEHHQAAQKLQQLDMNDWITRGLRNTIDEQAGRLQSGLVILASIGSIAPFVGLLGTVWGIYHALLGIGAAGNASIEAVAGPVGETLIMTALGLAVAIPAVLGYNALLRGNRFIMGRMNRFAHDLHAYFVTGSRVDRTGQHSPAHAWPPARHQRQTTTMAANMPAQEA